MIQIQILSDTDFRCRLETLMIGKNAGKYKIPLATIAVKSEQFGSNLLRSSGQSQ